MPSHTACLLPSATAPSSHGCTHRLRRRPSPQAAKEWHDAFLASNITVIHLCPTAPIRYALLQELIGDSTSYEEDDGTDRRQQQLQRDAQHTYVTAS